MPRKPMVRGNLPTYAANIRKLLRERELTHAQFADKVKLSKQSMYSALNGGDIRVSTLFRMARELKLEPYVLLMPEAPPKPAEVMPQPPLTPAWNLVNALLGGTFQPPPPTVPTQVTDLLNAWSKLSARDVATVMSFVKSLAENRVVDARHAVYRDQHHLASH